MQGSMYRGVRVALCGALGLASLLAAEAYADGMPASRLRSDWAQRLTEAGCPPRPGHPSERVCQNRESFAVCKEAVQANHLKRCRLAGTKEVYPPVR
jgi:hypothetical protein